MSGLAGILAHHHDPGVYRWHAAFPADEVAHAVEHAGWRFGYVDGWHHQTRHEFLTAVGEALAFPDHYGQNLEPSTTACATCPAARCCCGTAGARSPARTRPPSAPSARSWPSTTPR